MKKADFILFIAEKTGVDPVIVKEQVDLHIELLKQYMEENSELKMVNLGTFKTKQLEPGTVRNPKTGEMIHSDGWKRIIMSGNKNPLKGD
jgi:nucleoid DNA-binding protein